MKSNKHCERKEQTPGKLQATIHTTIHVFKTPQPEAPYANCYQGSYSSAPDSHEHVSLPIRVPLLRPRRLSNALRLPRVQRIERWRMQRHQKSAERTGRWGPQALPQLQIHAGTRGEQEGAGCHYRHHWQVMSGVETLNLGRVRPDGWEAVAGR